MLKRDGYSLVHPYWQRITQAKSGVFGGSRQTALFWSIFDADYDASKKNLKFEFLTWKQDDFLNGLPTLYSGAEIDPYCNICGYKAWFSEKNEHKNFL